MSGTDPSTRPWLLIEALQESVLRFATVPPSAHPQVNHVREINIAGVPTFTDALQQFGREAGISLDGLHCAIAIAGATSGEAFALARSRWTISRAGLAAVFGKPVTILNGVAARSWGIRSGTATVQTLRGIGRPDLAHPGRYLMLSISGGVGAAVIDVDHDGIVRILETEAGQMDFPAEGDREAKLAHALKGLNPRANWENMLLVEAKAPIWDQACPGMPDNEHARTIANALGRFTVNLLYAYNAWEGVLITGSRGSRILEAGSRPAFDAAFNDRRSLRRLMSACPVWLIDQREAVLTGAAQCLAQTLGFGMRNAA